jgi:hypothetical protein
MTATPRDPVDNPYAAPEAPIGEAPAGPADDLAEAEAIRRRYLGHETNVRSLGSLHYVGAVVMLLGVAILGASFVSWGTTGRGGRGAAAVMAVYLVMGLLNLALGVCLRRLRPWARWVEVALVSLSLLFSLGTLIVALVQSGGPEAGSVLLAGSISWAIPLYILTLLLSAKGSMVFSPEYAEVVARTPHVKYRTSVLAWVILLLFVVAILALIGAGLLMG